MKKKVVIVLKKNCSLSKHGYAIGSGIAKRHRALKAAVEEFGASYVIKKLNVLAIYRKNNVTKLHHYVTLRDDIKFVQRYRNKLHMSS